MNCAGCGIKISPTEPTVLEEGILSDLTAMYHPRCFEKKERHLGGKAKKDRLHARHDHGAVSEPGVGD
jgi:hypothetical protein